MLSDRNSEDDSVLTEHLQDQFVAWFVGVMAFFYLVEYLHGNQKKKQGKHYNHFKD